MQRGLTATWILKSVLKQTNRERTNIFEKCTHTLHRWLVLAFPAARTVWLMHTAISRKVVGKSARDNPERHCGWFWVHCSSKKFERMAREAMDVCLRVLKESNKSRFDSYSVRNSVLIISHITFRDCRVHIFSENPSRNSCIKNFIRPLGISHNSPCMPPKILH